MYVLGLPFSRALARTPLASLGEASVSDAADAGR